MVFHRTTSEIREMIEVTNEVMDYGRQEHQASTCTSHVSYPRVIPFSFTRLHALIYLYPPVFGGMQ